MNLKGLLKINYLQSFLLVFLLIFTSILTTSSTYVFKFLINSLSERDFKDFLAYLLVTVLLAVITGIGKGWTNYSFEKIKQAYLHQIRARLVKSYYYQNCHDISKMQNELSNNLKTLSDNFAQANYEIAVNSISFFLSLGVLLTLHWGLILITFFCFSLIMLAPKLLENYLARASKKVADKNQLLLKNAHNWLGGIEEIRRYHKKHKLTNELGQVAGKFEKAQLNEQKAMQFADFFNSGLNIGAQTLLAASAAILFFAHQLDLGSTMVASYFAFNIFASLGTLINQYMKLKSSRDLKQEILLSQKFKPILDNENEAVGGVKGQNLLFKYQNGEEIRYPDFEIKPGDKVLVTGESGVGKSTLFKLIIGELKPVAGQINFFKQNGQEIKNRNLDMLYLAQDAKLFPVSILDNITMFKNLAIDKVQKACKLVDFDRDLAVLPQGLSTIVNLANENLSGGQMQKIVLARASLHDTKFLLLDEATSAIDSKTSFDIFKNLLQREITIVVIAHNLPAETKKLFTHQIHLEKG
ncbi:ATP-binding cassette domain-containing protein [Lactobacillus mulieris]|uniref:ATP-binding cassette domain-containing protein n=1 Tax=Lactobacillus mulieris TaxID=2508708 RepID=UPI0022431ACB|nr:ABC transporter ATP-binding protein [Lactobacillus mulieris]MCW8123798.1 ABC transporter ATP-binding protein/permease [Lactobacillus mulieris]MDK7326784.1 ABC transporter ATP-binding protein [Lactobacillus mulieris]